MDEGEVRVDGATVVEVGALRALRRDLGRSESGMGRALGVGLWEGCVKGHARPGDAGRDGSSSVGSRTKARANESEVVPFFTPNPVTRPITKAEWEEGMPPDPSRRHTSQRRSE